MALLDQNCTPIVECITMLGQVSVPHNAGFYTSAWPHLGVRFPLCSAWWHGAHFLTTTTTTPPFFSPLPAAQWVGGGGGGEDLPACLGSDSLPLYNNFTPSTHSPIYLLVLHTHNAALTTCLSQCPSAHTVVLAPADPNIVVLYKQFFLENLS